MSQIDAAPAAIDAEKAQAIVRDVRDYIKRTRTSQREIASAIDVSPSVLGETLFLKYQGRQDDVLARLESWLEGQLQREQVQKPAEFVSTRVAEEVRTVAEIACRLDGIGVVYGESGIGKTLALRAVAADKPAAVFISLDTTKATPSGVIDAIRDALRLRSNNLKYRSTSRFIYNAVCETLKGSGRLLIFDQIHRLCGVNRNDAALYALADLFDATACPQLWCGSIDLVEYLERRERTGREPLSQIRRRIVICRDLMERTVKADGGPGEKLFTVDEIKEVFARSQIRLSADGVHYVTDLANLPGNGHLGDAFNVVVMATLLNQDAKAINAEMLRTAHRMLANRRAREELSRQLEDHRTTIARAG